MNKSLELRAIAPDISLKSNRKITRPQDFVLYRRRNPVEEGFNVLKPYTGIEKPCMKIATNFGAGVLQARARLARITTRPGIAGLMLT